jgi:hypothetical protein
VNHRFRITSAFCLGTVFVLAWPAMAVANGWAMNSEQVAELQAVGYQDMSPEQIARFFAHPNGHAGYYAIRAMAERGDTAVPLLDKLVTDSHPLVRQSALAALIEIRKQKLGDTPQDTPEIRHLIAQMKGLVDDPTLAGSIVNFIQHVGIENEDVHEIAVTIAQNSEPNLRSGALKMGRQLLKDPDTVVKIGMYSSAAPKNTPRTWALAHGLVARYKSDKVSRQAIPAVASFLRDTANTRPVRGMFSDSPQKSALAVIDAQWDADVQKMPEVVPAICRTYVRAPYSKYPGWITNREQVGRLLLRLDREAVPAIRATVAEEKRWLAEASGEGLATNYELKSDEARKRCEGFIAYLEYLADTLAAGRPVTQPPPGPPKQFEEPVDDKAPDLDGFDLDSLLD